MNRIYADILVDQRRFDEAIEQFQKTLELDPNFPTTRYFIGRAYEAKGNYNQAVAEYAIAAKLNGITPEAVARSSEVYAKSGWKAYLQESLNQILAQPPTRRFPSFVIATYYARLGQRTRLCHGCRRDLRNVISV